MTQNIGSLAVSLSMDASNFNASVKQVDRNLRAMGSELKATKALGVDYGKSIDGLKSKKDILSRASETASLKLQMERKRYDELVASGKNNEAQMEAQARRVNEAQAQYNKLASELAAVDKQLKIQSSSWTQLGAKLEPIGAKMKSVGEGMTNVGKKLTVGVTAPLAAMGVGAFKAAVEFESAFAGVRKTTDATEAEFAVLSKGIRDMSKDLPASASSIAGVAEAAGQLGIKKDDILAFTRTMIDLGESTNMTSEQAATELARFANITNMSMDKITNLGSTIVDLGNNSATTEGEIVSLGMRIAAAGNQAGMTEAEIMAISAAASSLGVEAEAGGTALSLAFTKITNAVDAGGDSLDAFAKASGISAKDFAKAWKEDPTVAFNALLKGLNASSKAGENMTAILDALGIKGIREIDVIKRMSSAHELVAESIGIANNAWDENTALSNEATQRYKTTESQMKMMVNQIKDIGITLGGVLIPIARDAMDALKPMVEKFAEMDEKTQKNIVAFGALAAAAGPLLVIGGSLMSGLGGAITTVSTLSTALGAAGGAAKVFGGALTIATGPVGITVAAIAALTAGGVALYKNWDKIMEMSLPLKASILSISPALTLVVGSIKLVEKAFSPALESAELFGEGISESTQKAVGSYLELDEKATLAINQLSWSQQRVTSEMAKSLIATYDEMNAQIISSMEASHAERLASVESLLANSISITKREKDEIVASVQDSQAQQASSVEEGQKRIVEILNIAAEEKRALTEREQKVIATIQENMKQTAVKVMSESQAEQKAILESLKREAEAITAEQAAAVVRNSVKQKEQVVKEAEEQYQKTIAEIIRLRDESKVISSDQADKLMADAKAQRDGVVESAKTMHNDVIREAKAQAKEHVNQVNWATGEIKKKWEVMALDVAVKSGVMAVHVHSKFKEMKDGAVNQAAEMAVAVTNKLENTKNAGSQAIEGLKSAITTKMAETKNTIVAKWNEAEKFLLSINLGAIGRDVIQGFINGIESKAKDISDKISNIANSIPKVFRTVLQTKSPSKVTTKIGEDTGAGIAVGLNKSSKSVEKASEGIATKVDKQFTKTMQAIVKQADNAASGTKKSTEKIKKSFNEAFSAVQHEYKTGAFSASQYVQALETVGSKYAKNADQRRKIAEELLKVEKAAAEERKKLEKESFDHSKTFIDAKKAVNEMSLAEELSAWERVHDRYKKGSEERIEAEKNIQRVRQEIYDQLLKANDDFLKKTQEINKNVEDEENRLNGVYEKAVEERTKSIRDFAGLFDEVVFKAEKTGEDLLSNLRGQVSYIEHWSHTIEQLAKRGIDGGLLEELRAMGPKAMPELMALNSLTDRQLREYEDLWKKKSKQAREIAVKEMTGLRTDTDKQISELHKRAAVQLEEVRKEFDTKVRSIRYGAENEFNAMKSTLPQIGKEAMQGLNSGLESMRGSVMSTARSIADQVSATIRSALKIKSPSRVMMEIGEYTGLGLIEGMESMMSGIQSAASRMGEIAVPNMSDAAMGSLSGGYASNNSIRQVQSMEQNIMIQPAPIYLDGQVIGEAVFNVVDFKMNDKRTSQLRYGGWKS